MQFSNSVRPRGRALLAPTATVWLRVGGGVPDAPMGTRTLRADIESAPTPTEEIGPGGVNVEGDGKALRKMQHSCIF